MRMAAKDPHTKQQAKADYSLERVRCLRKELRGLELDAMITLDPNNLRWLTAWQEVFDNEAAHLGIITKSKLCIHTDARYGDAMQAKNARAQSAATPFANWLVDTRQVAHFTYLQELLEKGRKHELRIGYEATLRLDQYKALKKALGSRTSALQVKLVETKGLFSGLRAIKDAEEIKLLRKAQSITDKAFAELLTWIVPGMSELEIANRLDFSMRKLGAEDVAFATIAASGPHAALPHARPTTRKIKKGDFLVLDFGARYRDYSADMTRTLAIGKASEKQRTLYEAVLAAQLTARKGLKAGITGKEAYDLANEVLKQRGFDKEFTHSLGHGVGIEVHEQPGLSPYNTQPLHSGNVVTVEPGVYLSGYGGVRIEDYGLVTEQGFTNFTKSPHDLIEING